MYNDGLRSSELVDLNWSNFQPTFDARAAFQKKIAEWRKKKMEIFWLPTYSPQRAFNLKFTIDKID